MDMRPTFFPTPAAFRRWLHRHHARADVLLVGYYKKDSGRPSITWPESVDEALCYGWIDGVRKRIDDASYTIRFTPRKPGSTWSSININRVRALIGENRMQPAGLVAFEARRENRSGIYSYEQRSVVLDDRYSRLLKRDAAAWRFYETQPASYLKAVNWWVVSARQEETRLRRLEKLKSFSARGQRVPQFTPRVGLRRRGHRGSR
jgi:uncharacterized protein YdeI (YjbR/CyaY-like superfamily)